MYQDVTCFSGWAVICWTWTLCPYSWSKRTALWKTFLDHVMQTISTVQAQMLKPHSTCWTLNILCLNRRLRKIQRRYSLHFLSPHQVFIMIQHVFISYPKMSFGTYCLAADALAAFASGSGPAPATQPSTAAGTASSTQKLSGNNGSHTTIYRICREHAI